MFGVYAPQFEHVYDAACNCSDCSTMQVLLLAGLIGMMIGTLVGMTVVLTKMIDAL